MNSSALEAATLACLKQANDDYADAVIKSSNALSGGYSRLTYRYEVTTRAGSQDMVLQYVPKGSTGLVRVDRNVENDLLKFLSTQDDINAPVMITSDLSEQFFDSPAYIFTAETGQPFIEVCREADVSEYSNLNKRMARAAASVHRQDISKLPKIMDRPTSWNDYLDEQIEAFVKTEKDSRTPRPFLRFMAKWLDENRPPPAPLSLVHGDFQVSNLLNKADTDDTVMVDWELSHIGDPREDLGWFTMVCGAIPPNILEADVEGFYDEYRAQTGFNKEIINPSTAAYFLIISSIRTHMGMMKSSDALAENAAQAQSVLAAYYLNITSYQHMNWMNAIKFVESQK